MNRFKNALWRSIPVFAITIATLVMSFIGFGDMIDEEEQKCLDYLSVATRTLEEKVRLRFDANLELLAHVGEAVVLKVDLDHQEEVLGYLSAIQENDNNFFSRIDILLPDNTLVMQNGDVIPYTDNITYEEMLAQGVHVSQRFEDILTGKQVVYCIAPMTAEGRNVALLIGMVDCSSLPSYFSGYSYDGQAKNFIVDCLDGSFIMDSFHPELGNIAGMGPFEAVEGFEKVSFQQELAERKEGAVGFVSAENGSQNYMYYRPVAGYNWSVAVMLQDEVVFHDVYQLHDTLTVMCIVEVLLLAFYLGWNLFMSLRLSGHEEKEVRMEAERMDNVMKANFLSTMSHDIRTPLNGIVGMLDVIERHGDDPERLQDCLQKIGISTQYLMTLTNDMLDLNEIESGSFQLIPEPMDLRRLMEEISVLVKSRADEAGITCHTDLSRVKHACVMGSEVHLRRILVNLVTNAIKYNKPDGEVFITMEEGETQGEGAAYRFTVRDTGIGMSKEFQKTMFDSFSQERSDARTRYRGHGLGLAIVNRLVQKMHGDIQVESEKEKGSTFVVTLTLDFAPEGSCQAAAGAVSSDLTGMRILLVEDNELNMEIARILLTDAGAEVAQAVNGREAVELFAASEPFAWQAILMDVMMPEMDGLEATRAIRAMARADAQKVPIIAMTAGTFAEDIRRCKEAGMNEHVGKPLNMSEMIAKIAKYANE